MTDQTPETPEAPAHKSRFRKSPKTSDGTNAGIKSKAHSAKEKAKTAAAVVGVVAVGGVIAARVAKRRGTTGVTVTLPDVDTTTES